MDSKTNKYPPSESSDSRFSERMIQVASTGPRTLYPPTVGLPDRLLASRLPQPTTASLRCGLLVQSHAESRPDRR
jgi:hypothetical protein